MKNKMKKGFTLVELLIVIAIIAILAAITIPQFVGMLDRARDTNISSYMRAMGVRATMVNIDTGSFATVLCAVGNTDIIAICASLDANSPGTTASFADANNYCKSIELNFPIGAETHWCVDHTGFSGRVAGAQCTALQIRCRL